MSGSSTTPTSTVRSSTTSRPSIPTRSARWSTSGIAEAGANDGFPLDDRSALEILIDPRPQLSPPANRYVYFPTHAEVPEAQAVIVRNRSFTIGALVDIPAPGAQGVLFAHGSRFGATPSTSRTTDCTT